MRITLTPSLRLRLGSAAVLVLGLFLGMTGMVFDHGFGQAAREAVKGRLQARVYTLLTAAELSADGRLLLPDHLPEVGFSTPGSGLYARVLDGSGRVVWHSRSTLGRTLPPGTVATAGEQSFEYLPSPAGEGLFQLHFGVEWEGDSGVLWPFSLELSEHDQGYLNQVSGFRHTLWYGLGAVAIALLIAQALVLAWGLRPLRRVSDDLEAIRAGHRDHLQGRYPRELRPFTDSINRFISQERAGRDRYRNSLGDLAHSLKTPLAVLKTTLEGSGARGSEADRATVVDQLQRMGDIVNYQLGRAAAAGSSPLAAPVAIRPLATSLRSALDKVNHQRSIDCTLAIPDHLNFHGDKGDLMELLGNLLDNAYKWAEARVKCGGAADQQGAGQGDGLKLWVEDDGPGIPDREMDRVLGRGQRIDAEVDGQGIGLAVVQDLVEAYGGTVMLHRGELGGLRVELRFPAPSLQKEEGC